MGENDGTTQRRTLTVDGHLAWMDEHGVVTASPVPVTRPYVPTSNVSLEIKGFGNTTRFNASDASGKRENTIMGETRFECPLSVAGTLNGMHVDKEDALNVSSLEVKSLNTLKRVVATNEFKITNESRTVTRDMIRRMNAEGERRNWLDTNFKRHDKTRSTGRVIETMYNTTVDDCLTRCMHESTCRSVTQSLFGDDFSNFNEDGEWMPLEPEVTRHAVFKCTLHDTGPTHLEHDDALSSGHVSFTRRTR